MKTIRGSEIMSREILTVGPDWSVERLMDFMTDKNVSGAPVVGDDGEPIGVVSLSDIVRNGAVIERTTSETSEYYRRLDDFVAPEEKRSFRVEGDARATVRDIMTPMLFTVDEETPVQEIAAMMITGRIHRVFVKNGGKLTGVVSSMDLLPLVRDM